MGVFGGFNISEDGDTIHGQRLSVLTRNALGQFDDEVGGFLPEDDFAFDEEGNLYEINCPTADATQVDEDFSLRRAGSATSNVEIFQRGRTAAPLTQRVSFLLFVLWHALIYGNSKWKSTTMMHLR